MKKLALSFTLLTVFLCACSTSKSGSNASMQQLTNSNSSKTAEAPVKQKAVETPAQEAQMLNTNTPERYLVKKKADKTMAQTFEAATAVRDSL